MKSKLKFIVPVLLLVVLGGAYKFVLAKPEAHAKPKVHGEVYVLQKEFLVNLADDRFAKLNVALVIEEGSAAAAGHEGATPPEGYGTLPQEAVVRDIVTDALTESDARALIDREGREQLKRRIARAIRKHTDVKIDEVLFTDVAVQ